jgi:hypothetical protein
MRRAFFIVVKDWAWLHYQGMDSRFTRHLKWERRPGNRFDAHWDERRIGFY